MADSLRKQVQDAIAAKLKTLTATFEPIGDDELTAICETPKEMDAAKSAITGCDDGQMLLLFTVLPGQREPMLGYYEQEIVTTCRAMVKISDGQYGDTFDIDDAKEEARDYFDTIERAVDGAMMADETFGELAQWTTQKSNDQGDIICTGINDLVIGEMELIYSTIIHYRRSDDTKPC